MANQFTKRRKALGLKPIDVASKAGVSESTYRRLETGKAHSHPATRKAVEIAFAALESERRSA